MLPSTSRSNASQAQLLKNRKQKNAYNVNSKRLKSDCNVNSVKQSNVRPLEPCSANASRDIAKKYLTNP